MGRRGGHREHGARRAQRDGDVARLQAEAEGRAHVVARPGRDHRVAVRARGRVRRQHGGCDIGIERDQCEHLGDVPVAGGRPVAGARRVTAIGDQLAGELQRQPVVGEQDVRDAVEHRRLVRAQPGELGDGERCDRHRPHDLRPPCGAPRRDQLPRLGCRLRVVPELGRPQHAALVVEHHHAVLLAGDTDRLDVAPVLVEQRRQRVPPAVRVLLAARRHRRGVRTMAGTDELAAVGVAHFELAPRRRGVDPGNQGHQRTPRRSSVTSWSRRSCP